jgi:PhnB protein
MGVNPYLVFKGNCKQAIEFYRKALDAELLFLQTVGESPMSNMGPAENIMHCSLKVGGSTIMMSDGMGPDAPPGEGREHSG